MKVVQTKNAPQAIGPYSQGIIVNNMFYSSGPLYSITLKIFILKIFKKLKGK